ncbi:carbohydrate ABC transporter permease [Pseudonocardia nigra]|uniref:carbohydrate ABC transporter permease n=1 Tax=Pseudonocardia nigra TaxID=1921578 RepID=UPI001C601232|nr:carbohydrate ABC transporter permease [Pseudonocardia nigra]
MRPGKGLSPAAQVRRATGRGLYYAAMVALALLFLLPLIWMLSTSLKTEAQTLSIPPTFIPTDPQWNNYVEVFRIVPTFLYNSVKLAVLNVVGLLFFCSLAGYAFGRLNFPGRDAAFLVLLATAILPSIVYLLPQYILFLNLGWIDTHYPLWVPRILTPVIGTFLLRQSFKTIPNELEDAAKIDGASTFRIYWQVMLPQVKPAMAAVGILTFLESWNDLFGPLIFLNSRDLQTLPVALALFQGEFLTRVDLLMAGATISVVPVLVLFFAAQRYFIQGISMEGLKG